MISKVVVQAYTPPAMKEWSLAPHPHQHVLSLEILILVILTGVRWNLRVDLLCIFLLTKDLEHFLKLFSVILDSSVENSV